MKKQIKQYRNYLKRLEDPILTPLCEMMINIRTRVHSPNLCNWENRKTLITKSLSREHGIKRKIWKIYTEACFNPNHNCGRPQKGNKTYFIDNKYYSFKPIPVVDLDEDSLPF